MAKPTIENLQRQVALLASSLREFMRIAKDAESDPSCAAPEIALEGKLLSQWRKAKKNAEHVLKDLP